jgi:hypothetical protein
MRRKSGMNSIREVAQTGAPKLAILIGFSDSSPLLPRSLGFAGHPVKRAKTGLSAVLLKRLDRIIDGFPPPSPEFF